jgi:hypothetical protein
MRDRMKAREIELQELRRSFPLSFPSASRECGASDVKTRAAVFPPPLPGRDREGGEQQAQRWPSIRSRILAISNLVTAKSIARNALWPPLSLSLPRKGGGNRVARTFATHRSRFWRCVHALVSLAFSLIAATHALAQTDAYPSRPITILVPFAAGGSSDVVMRLVSKHVSENLNQPIVIENRPGGSGNVAAMAVKNAPRDGYLLMMGHTGSHAINATL